MRDRLGFVIELNPYEIDGLFVLSLCTCSCDPFTVHKVYLIEISQSLDNEWGLLITCVGQYLTICKVTYISSTQPLRTID